ncbi:hypothetical protein [Fluviispira multicolorata]|uniref:Uncharacterized protein n=1 Tax=Fluviispira multicolorata TaxID=2654512 RepID=A0A833JF06_9BACT|nr:hypothetical protein [Fluviispira multicolorata]KAB8033480.1 hypothetical protein GCL57_01900 [Fluviispira multicolorata]
MQQNLSNLEIMNQLKNNNQAFVVLEVNDFICFIKKNKALVNNNFILMPQEKESFALENHKEEIKKIRFIIGNPPNDLLKIFLKHIFEFKNKENQKGICSYFDKENIVTFKHDVMHSSERSGLQQKVTDFFQQEIQKNKDKLVAGTNSYAKSMGDILDEFLMNAIWDANPKRASTDRSQAIALNESEKVNLLCIFDTLNFILSVSDQFGTFYGATIEKYICHALGLKDPGVGISQGTAGAGLGIFMVMQKIGVLIFEVEKGKITRATAIARGDQAMRELQKKPKTILFFERG